MGTLRGFPYPPASALRRAKPASALPLVVAVLRLRILGPVRFAYSAPASGSPFKHRRTRALLSRGGIRETYLLVCSAPCRLPCLPP